MKDQQWVYLVYKIKEECLAYSLMTVLKQLSGGSVGDVKFKIADEALGISSAIDIIDRNLAA